MHDSRGQSIDERIDLLLARRYPRAQLNGLGKLSLKKIGKKLKKIVKKVAPIAIGGAALYFGAKAVTGKKSKKSKAGSVAASVAHGAVQVAVPLAQAAAAQAISAGAIPLQPGALRSNEELLATAVQIARSELAQQGLNMNSPEAQGVLRQAVQEADQVPPAEAFDWKKALPWAAGAGLVVAAVTMGARRPR